MLLLLLFLLLLVGTFVGDPAIVANPRSPHRGLSVDAYWTDIVAAPLLFLSFWLSMSMTMVIVVIMTATAVIRITIGIVIIVIIMTVIIIIAVQVSSFIMQRISKCRRTI